MCLASKFFYYPHPSECEKQIAILKSKGSGVNQNLSENVRQTDESQIFNSTHKWQKPQLPSFVG